MIKWIRKGLFLAPFALFFFAAERYGDQNLAENTIEQKHESISTDKSIVVKPGERLKVIVKSNKVLSHLERQQPLVLLSNGVGVDYIGENDAVYFRYFSPHIADHLLVCYPSGLFSSGEYAYECTVPDYSGATLSLN